MKTFLVLLSVIALSACSITPRDGRLPEVTLHVAKDYCDKVRFKDSMRGVVMQCINYFDARFKNERE